jgi:hypothetical protein
MIFPEASKSREELGEETQTDCGCAGHEKAAPEQIQPPRHAENLQFYNEFIRIFMTGKVLD